MAMNISEVEEALQSLDRHDRLSVIHRAIRSLNSENTVVAQGEVDAAWRTELRRRVDDIENGDVKLLDVEESHAQLRAELAAHRK